MPIYYIGLGSDCSPAAALRNLNLRPFALPFDWVVSTTDRICLAIRNKFENYHDQLRISYTNTSVVDGYGFVFPHDYPTIETTDVPTDEEFGPNETTLHPEWFHHINYVQEKYIRRIERFIKLLSSSDPLIMLYRGTVNAIPMFRTTFLDCFQKTNIAYVVATSEESPAPDIFTCQPEAFGDWNNKHIWMTGIKSATEFINKK